VSSRLSCIVIANAQGSSLLGGVSAVAWAATSPDESNFGELRQERELA